MIEAKEEILPRALVWEVVRLTKAAWEKMGLITVATVSSAERSFKFFKDIIMTSFDLMQSQFPILRQSMLKRTWVVLMENGLGWCWPVLLWQWLSGWRIIHVDGYICEVGCSGIGPNLVKNYEGIGKSKEEQITLISSGTILPIIGAGGIPGLSGNCRSSS